MGKVDDTSISNASTRIHSIDNAPNPWRNIKPTSPAPIIVAPFIYVRLGSDRTAFIGENDSSECDGQVDSHVAVVEEFKETMVLRFLKWSILTLFLVLALGAGYFWYTFMSPYGYHPANTVTVDERVSNQDVFVYGTLKNEWLRWLVMGTPEKVRNATLPGYQRHDLDILPTPGGTVEGEVLTVTPAALKALDRYERLGIRYERDSVKLADGSITWVYRRIH